MLAPRVTILLLQSGHARWGAENRRTPVAMAHVALLGECCDAREHWGRRGDSNPQPTVYKTVALPLSYIGQRERTLPAAPGRVLSIVTAPMACQGYTPA